MAVAPNESVLDNPVWLSLAGRHAPLGRTHGRAARYRPEVSLVAALAEPTREAFDDLVHLVEPGDMVGVLDAGDTEHPSFERAGGLTLTQLVCRAPVSSPEPRGEIRELGAADVPDMLRLTEVTRPGPFESGTIEMGTYLGACVDGRLAAMAGERFAPHGFTEISGVCTDPDFRGRRYADHLVRRLVADVQARGEQAFLHVMVGSPSEATARGVYERIGFEPRRRVQLTLLKRL